MFSEGERLEKSESDLKTLLREVQNEISYQFPSNYGGKVTEVHKHLQHRYYIYTLRSDSIYDNQPYMWVLNLDNIICASLR